MEPLHPDMAALFAEVFPPRNAAEAAIERNMRQVAATYATQAQQCTADLEQYQATNNPSFYAAWRVGMGELLRLLGYQQGAVLSIRLYRCYCTGGDDATRLNIS